MEQSSSTHVVIQTSRSTSIQSCTKPLIRCHHHHVPPNPFTLLDTPLLREPNRLPHLALILYSDRTVRYGPQHSGRTLLYTPEISRESRDATMPSFQTFSTREIRRKNTDSVDLPFPNLIWISGKSLASSATLLSLAAVIASISLPVVFSRAIGCQTLAWL